MSMSVQRGSLAILGVAALLAAASQASASISASDPFLVIRATNASGSATYQVPLSAADTLSDPDVDLWGWVANQSITLTSPGGSVIAEIVSFSCLSGRAVQAGGEMRFGIDWDFSVVAGSSATTFEFYSPTLRFNSVPDARAISSAGYNAQDNNSSGVSLVPGLPGSFGYQSLVNVPVGSPASLDFSGLGGTAFQSYLDRSLAGVPNGSDSQDGNPVPAGVFSPVGGSVSSMRSQMAFTLSAFDAAAGSNQFSVAPAPGAMGLLGLGGLIAARRRR